MYLIAAKKLLTGAGLLGLATMAGAAACADSAPDRPSRLMAQAAPPPSAASAPAAADGQADHRETPARPTGRRRGVGVVISMNVG